MFKMLGVCQLKDNSRAVKDGNETVLIGEYHQVLTSLLQKKYNLLRHNSAGL
jgi:hypothetical protein